LIGFKEGLVKGRGWGDREIAFDAAAPSGLRKAWNYPVFSERRRPRAGAELRRGAIARSNGWRRKSGW